MKHRYTYEEVRAMGRPPEIEMHAYNTTDGFERASGDIVECRERTKKPASDPVYLVPEGEGTFSFGGEEGQKGGTVPVGDHALPSPKSTVHDHEGRMRLFLSCSAAYDQASDGLWG